MINHTKRNSIKKTNLETTPGRVKTLKGKMYEKIIIDIKNKTDDRVNSCSNYSIKSTIFSSLVTRKNESLNTNFDFLKKWINEKKDKSKKKLKFHETSIKDFKLFSKNMKINNMQYKEKSIPKDFVKLSIDNLNDNLRKTTNGLLHIKNSNADKKTRFTKSSIPINNNLKEIKGNKNGKKKEIVSLLLNTKDKLTQNLFH